MSRMICHPWKSHYDIPSRSVHYRYARVMEPDSRQLWDQSDDMLQLELPRNARLCERNRIIVIWFTAHVGQKRIEPTDSISRQEAHEPYIGYVRMLSISRISFKNLIIYLMEGKKVQYFQHLAGLRHSSAFIVSENQDRTHCIFKNIHSKIY